MSNLREDKVKIRSMIPIDIDSIESLDKEIGSGYGLLSPADLNDIKRSEGAYLNFVAELKGKIVGFIISQLTYPMIPTSEVCVIQGIFVHPAHQEHRIGSQLAQALINHCKDEGINTIRALVPQHDTKLRQFIEWNGFRRSTIINYDKTFEN